MEENMSTKMDDSFLFTPELDPSTDMPGPSEQSSGTQQPSVNVPLPSNNTTATAFRHGLSPSMKFVGKSWTESTTDPTTENSAENGQSSKITLYFLQSSRSIRIAWLLEELKLVYNLEYFDREPSMAAPVSFKQACGGSMGKAPVLVDGDLVIEESGAITQYLIATYDNLNYLLPSPDPLYVKTLLFMHAAEGTFLLHGLVPFYVKRADPDTPEATLEALKIDTGKDLDWLEAELKTSGTRYLVGDTVTAADTMMGFSVQFIMEFDLYPAQEEGVERWQYVIKWLGNIECSKPYQRAVKKTGHTLRPK